MKKISRIVAVAIAFSAVFIGCKKEKTGGEGSSSGAASKPLNLIIAHNQTSLENPYAYGINAFKEKLEDISGGQITVTCHHGTLGENENELVEKLQMGAASIVVVSPGFMASVGVPEVDVFSLEYLFKSFDHWRNCLDGQFGTELADLINKKSGNNFRILGYWSAAVRDYYGKKPIRTPADLKGMTIRIQSAAVQQQFWKACGAVPTSVAWGELYQALQQGVVDSAENDYTNFMLKEHHKTKNGHFICETEHDFTTRLMLIDGSFYDKLTDQQKAWVDQASKYATQVERQKTFEQASSSKAKVIADGAEIVDNKDIDIEAFVAIAVPIQDEFAKKTGMERYIQMVRDTK